MLLRTCLFRFEHETASGCPSCIVKIEDAEHMFDYCTCLIEECRSLDEVVRVAPIIVVTKALATAFGKPGRVLSKY